MVEWKNRAISNAHTFKFNAAKNCAAFKVEFVIWSDIDVVKFLQNGFLDQIGMQSSPALDTSRDFDLQVAFLNLTSFERLCAFLLVMIRNLPMISLLLKFKEMPASPRDDSNRVSSLIHQNERSRMLRWLYEVAAFAEAIFAGIIMPTQQIDA